MCQQWSQESDTRLDKRPTFIETSNISGGGRRLTAPPPRSGSNGEPQGRSRPHARAAPPIRHKRASLAAFVLAPGSEQQSARGVAAGPKVATNGADRRIARCSYRPDSKRVRPGLRAPAFLLSPATVALSRPGDHACPRCRTSGLPGPRSRGPSHHGGRLTLVPGSGGAIEYPTSLMDASVGCRVQRRRLAGVVVPPVWRGLGSWAVSWPSSGR
jgi:hypothetical protein